MDADYESVKWLTEISYNVFKFSDGVMFWAVLAPLYLMFLYALVCVALIPLSVTHRGMSDIIHKRFSVRNLVTTALHCYPVLLPWLWKCESQHEDLRRLYYVIINAVWFLSIGLGSFHILRNIHEAVITSGTYSSAWENDKIPIGVHEAIIFVIIANLTFAYSIGLLIWKHRVDARRNEKEQVEKSPKIYYHPSVMLNVWMVAVFSGVAGNGIDLRLTLMFGASLLTLVWIVVSCYQMVQKEIRLRREVKGGVP